MAEAGKVPVRESVGAAARAVRENARFVGTLALGAGAAAALITLLLALAPALGLVLNVLSWGLNAFVYAALLAAFLSGPAAAVARWGGNGLRVWAAVVVVGFFVAIVSLVLLIAISVALGPFLLPFAQELQSVGEDRAAAMTLLVRMVSAAPAPFAIAGLFFSAVLLMLTSRLYLAAPASLELGRLMTFETWAWTKGSMLRICAARLMLLAPAYVLVAALSALAGGLMGADVTTPAGFVSLAEGNAFAASLFVFATSVVGIGIYTALEAALSAYLYRGLKPADVAPLATPSTDSAPLG